MKRLKYYIELPINEKNINIVNSSIFILYEIGLTKVAYIMQKRPKQGRDCSRYGLICLYCWICTLRESAKNNSWRGFAINIQSWLTQQMDLLSTCNRRTLTSRKVKGIFAVTWEMSQGSGSSVY